MKDLLHAAVFCFSMVLQQELVDNKRTVVGFLPFFMRRVAFMEINLRTWSILRPKMRF